MGRRAGPSRGLGKRDGKIGGNGRRPLRWDAALRENGLSVRVSFWNGCTTDIREIQEISNRIGRRYSEEAAFPSWKRIPPQPDVKKLDGAKALGRVGIMRERGNLSPKKCELLANSESGCRMRLHSVALRGVRRIGLDIFHCLFSILKSWHVICIKECQLREHHSNES